MAQRNFCTNYNSFKPLLLLSEWFRFHVYFNDSFSYNSSNSFLYFIWGKKKKENFEFCYLWLELVLYWNLQAIIERMGELEKLEWEWGISTQTCYFVVHQSVSLLKELHQLCIFGKWSVSGSLAFLRYAKPREALVS